MKKAVFLDRDGTIIEDKGYLSNIEGITILPGAVEAVKSFNERDFKVILITNQSGVARNIVTERMVRMINDKVIELFNNEGAKLDEAYYCPHHPTIGEEPYKKDCDCRKPSPGMIIKAAKEHEIDLKKSFIVGDKMSDVDAGKNCGLKTVFLTLSRFDKKDAVKADHYADNISCAAKWILEKAVK